MKPTFTTLGLLFFLIFACQPSNVDLSIPYDNDKNITPTYEETITWWTKLSATFPKKVQLVNAGPSDSGEPIYLAILSMDSQFLAKKNAASNKNIFFINNAIHAGESCGVDATMLLYRELLTNPAHLPLLANTVIISTPIYNVGGALYRNKHTRANQNGPHEHGFRANAKNLDLNRDFIKADSKNVQTFYQIFQEWQPDVFLDTHTSNGADYSYTMTFIASQHDKMETPMADFQENEVLPFLYQQMEEKSWPMTPYVYARNTPANGIAGFLDLPRYASGYSSLFHAFSFTSETHMLKAYEGRVESTKALMFAFLELLESKGIEIKEVRNLASEAAMQKDTFDLNWTIDFTKADSLSFDGYTADYKPSQVSGHNRLWYDHSRPYTKKIPYFNTYKTTQSIIKPKGYIIPQAWGEVIERLEWSGIEMEVLLKDTLIEVEMYAIEDFETVKDPYEGHYLHSAVKVQKEIKNWKYRKGDLYIPTNQAGIRFIIETLEPQAPDSYFAWNFFDGILQQKEYFSPYVFEDTAAEYLKENPQLAAEFEKAIIADTSLANSGYQQLRWIYNRGPWHEKTHKVYPVGRILE